MCSGDDEDDAPGDFSSVFICDWPSSARRFIACRSAVKFKLTTTVAVPGASRFQLRTWLFNLSSITFEPWASAALVFLSLISARYHASKESGSRSSALTLISFALCGTGSHGFPVVKPAFTPESHCIGVRSPSRPRFLGQFG